jgi:hypothetical protein
VQIQVVDLPFDREILLVDDSFDDTYPRDSENDAFWAALLENHGDADPAKVGVWQMHGSQDREALQPRTPTLADLGRYQTLVWDIRGTGFDGVTGLSNMLPTGRLQAHLRAGGQLWLSGRMSLAALTAPDSDPAARGDFTYPKLGLGPGDFAWDFLKLRSTRIDNDRGSTGDGRNNLSEAQPFPGRPGIYPLLQVDTGKQNPLARDRGIPGCDAIFDPLLVNSEPGFRGTVDSLYAYGATGNVLLGTNSPYHQKLTGIRWHDPDPDREHGRIQWFGFPMYYMKDAQAQEIFNRSLDWFREETADAP